MPFYALATLVSYPGQLYIQAWHADDANACEGLSDLCLWWDHVSQFSPSFGYFPNAKKMWLVVREQFLDHACKLLSETCANVTAEGRPYLGAAIGS